MAGNKYAWSTTAATNASADATINWAEGQMPSTVNDSARAMMAVEAAFLADTNAALTTGGTGAAYTVTSNLTPAALATGLKLRLKMNATNTGACTLTVTPNGAAAFAAKSIRIYGSAGEANPAAGQLQNGGIYEFNYDAAANAAAGAWMLLNPTDVSFVVGPASATDNAAARFDLTTGKLIQDSVLLVADTTGDLSRSGNGGIDIQGTNTNDSASAGYIGEVITNQATGGLTSGVAANITSISVTAGDWDVYGSIYMVSDSALNSGYGGISATSATLGSAPSYFALVGTSSNPIAQAVPTQRVSLAGTTTYYLVAQAGGTGNISGNGTITARRAR